MNRHQTFLSVSQSSFFISCTGRLGGRSPWSGRSDCGQADALSEDERLVGANLFADLEDEGEGGQIHLRPRDVSTRP